MLDVPPRPKQAYLLGSAQEHDDRTTGRISLDKLTGDLEDRDRTRAVVVGAVVNGIAVDRRAHSQVIEVRADHYSFTRDRRV